MEKLSRLPGIRLFGPQTSGTRAWSVFLLTDIHAHDVVTVADQHGVALRGGHHCNQPLMKKLGVESTARASFYFYNTAAEVDRLVEVLTEIQKFFGAMNDLIDAASHDEARAGSFSRRATGLVPPLSHRRLRQLRLSAGRNAGRRLCARNNLNVAEVIRHIQTSHEQDAGIANRARRTGRACAKAGGVRLVDIRSREEFEAAHIEGAVLLSQPVMQDILGHWPREELMVIYDHRGQQSLDAAAYFIGPGLPQRPLPARRH